MHRMDESNNLIQCQQQSSLNVCFWNAGGFTPSKYKELRSLLYENNVDVMGIVESGAAADRLDDFKITGYNEFSLQRGRKVASGIVVYVRETASAEMNIIHAMTKEEEDKLEAVEIKVMFGSFRLRVLFVYNPPRNEPNLDCLIENWDERSIILGDFNAPSKRWGYERATPIGRKVEKFIDKEQLDFVENKNRLPTFVSYSGAESHPDLLLVHPNLTLNVIHQLMQGPGEKGHKILAVCVTDNGQTLSEQHC